MLVVQLPALKDNFIYILIDEASTSAAVIDPAQASVVLDFLEENNLKLTKIFNTHHHSDHIGGNKELILKFPGVEVYASFYDKGRIPGQKYFLHHNDSIFFAEERATVYYIPGHTLGHIAYHFKLKNKKEYLFIGDTIFSGGCGKLFEGTPAQMLTSLKFLRDNVADETIIYCAHEYTVENYSILAKLEPNNLNIKEKLNLSMEMRKNNLFTVPFTMRDEKKYNSFLRWDDAELKKVTATESDLDTFTFLRKYRDNA